ncbi:MAG: TetR/AcrR family transcriptional regulator [Lachnospiraceae bacterium]|nr:TetR/AcrR family transcriptional regulator [Lachnospiraceae bacterium]
MPPKKKFTKEEITRAAFEMAREKGIESVVARELGKKLGTSSSPIFTAFRSMEEVQQEVRALALKEFESYVSDALNFTPAFKYVGMKMIEFAMREPKLFRLIYMQERAESQSYEEMVMSLGDTVEVCIRIMQRDYGLNQEDAEMLFKMTWLHTFSICALVVNKVCHFSMEEISEILSVSFQGALMLIKSGTFHTIPVNKQEKP